MTNCPTCEHPQHAPGDECEHVVTHGTSRLHRCLCLARPGAERPCPPLMSCQGGPFGYADLWNLQHGQSIKAADGRTITPDILTAPASSRRRTADTITDDELDALYGELRLTRHLDANIRQTCTDALNRAERAERLAQSAARDTAKALTDYLAAEQRAEQAEAALAALSQLFDGLDRLLATSSRDWGATREDAWLWAVICGWDCEPGCTDIECAHDTLQQMADAFGWDDAAIAKARRYRAAVRALPEPPPLPGPEAATRAPEKRGRAEAVLMEESGSRCGLLSAGGGPVSGQPCRRREGHTGYHEAFIRTAPDQAYSATWASEG
ncbi:hypothetical protein LG634_24755 [Streptomyces bambusae]|uniref:hypothetical protein n=1 Tax=Streptomyces bambusae TaxID=1550616 RepID=UPI001CFD1AF4|nr:hypothetical protein [Streptomyces bambusae]MCB5168024.1 hypothetical protein [Streptomyces bambusae]